jgi:hypothetical protein
MLFIRTTPGEREIPIGKREWRSQMSTANPTHGLRGDGFVKKASGWLIGICDSGGLGVHFWRRGALGRSIRRRRSGTGSLAGADRNCVPGRRILFFDAPIAGARNTDAGVGGNYPDGRGDRINRLLPFARRRWLELVADERDHHPAARRADLVPLAVQFRLGYRNAGGREPADDRILAANVRLGSTETREPLTP